MTSRPSLLLALLLGLVAIPTSADAQAQKESPPQEQQKKEVTKHIEPKADQLLRQMTTYLANLKSFRVENTAIDEVVTTTGQKLQFVSVSQVSVVRPNRLRSEQLGAGNGLAFTYNGKTMSLYCGADKSFATTAAPPTLDATIDKVRKDYEIDAPGADLLYANPYEILTEQVTGGKFIGIETVGGLASNHLAFEGEEVDWQIWIQDGAQPLPLRYVITSKLVKGQPQFTVQLNRWEPQAKLADSVFEVQTPAGARKVAKFPTNCGQTGIRK